MDGFGEVYFEGNDFFGERDDTENFEVNGEKCVKIRHELIEAYKNQGSDLDVVFKCKDGEHRAGRSVLTYVSQFFASQLEARDRMGNELVFNYPEHSKLVIKSFADIMYSLKVKLDLMHVLELIEFIKYEGKTGVSEFENDLLKNLCDKLAKSNMQATQKLLICLVFDKLDDFKGVMSKRLFADVCAEKLLNSLLTIDLTTGVNEELKNMVKANTKNDMEIETQLYAMIKTMKNNKVTKQFVDITFCVSPNGRVNPNRGWGGQERFSYSVNRNGTTKQLISDLNDKLKEIFPREQLNVNELSIKGVRLDRDISNWGWGWDLKEGDTVEMLLGHSYADYPGYDDYHDGYYY